MGAVSIIGRSPFRGQELCDSESGDEGMLGELSGVTGEGVGTAAKSSMQRSLMKYVESAAIMARDAGTSSRAIRVNQSAVNLNRGTATGRISCKGRGCRNASMSVGKRAAPIRYVANECVDHSPPDYGLQLSNVSEIPKGVGLRGLESATPGLMDAESYPFSVTLFKFRKKNFASIFGGFRHFGFSAAPKGMGLGIVTLFREKNIASFSPGFPLLLVSRGRVSVVGL